MEDFRRTSANFLKDNFYCIAQKYYLSYIHQKITNNLSICFENHLNDLIVNVIQHNDMIEKINQCFLKKFADFEARINVPNSNNYNFNLYYSNHNPVANPVANKELPQPDLEESFNNNAETPEIKMDNINFDVEINPFNINLEAPKINSSFPEKREIKLQAIKISKQLGDLDSNNY